MARLRKALFGGTHGNRLSTDVGLIILRIACGLPMLTIFEKFLPREGVWGPQEWFVNDVVALGFPAPLFFAWCAVLAEFVGGTCIIIGLATRPAAFFLAITMSVAAFAQHDMDFAKDGLLATIFLFLSVSILVSGAGRFSVDHRLTPAD